MGKTVIVFWFTLGIRRTHISPDTYNSPLTSVDERQIVKMEESPRICRFRELPSAEEFACRIESRNVPAVFNGCVKSWKAFSKWNASNGGLDYLEELVGSSVVAAMLSRSAPVFDGDIRRHERVPLPFSTFIRYCKDLLQCGDGAQDSNSPLRKNKPVEHIAQHGDHITEEECSHQIYLAQVPIMNAENEEKAQLECLREDIEIPAFLEGKILASINLWMNNARTRSSTHYDPHHNLLCIISGCKQGIAQLAHFCIHCPCMEKLRITGIKTLVKTVDWIKILAPHIPIFISFNSNVIDTFLFASAIPLENTDFSLYPRAKSVDEYSQKVILHAGDAVFIPEGWFHQVDSEDLTIAVNFWWRSDIMSSMSEHMDAYYLRRILKRLTDQEIARMLGIPSCTVNKKNITACRQPHNVQHRDDTVDIKDIATDGQPGNDNGHQKEDLPLNHRTVTAKENELEFSLHELQPHALKSLHELVSLVHNCVNQNQSVSDISADQSVSCQDEEDGFKGIIKTDIFNLEADATANVVWSLDPCTFRNVFLAMAHNFPRTLEALVMHGLSPVGAEVLTRKFEQMDQVISEDYMSQFYQKFYSVFDNQFSAMDTLLNGKESFASQAFNNVLVQYLGTNPNRAKPSRE